MTTTHAAGRFGRTACGRPYADAHGAALDVRDHATHANCPDCRLGMIGPTDPAQAEYRFTCPDCRSTPGQACRSWTSGAAMHTSHRARYNLLTADE